LGAFFHPPKSYLLGAGAAFGAVFFQLLRAYDFFGVAEGWEEEEEEEGEEGVEGGGEGAFFFQLRGVSSFSSAMSVASLSMSASMTLVFDMLGESGSISIALTSANSAPLDEALVFAQFLGASELSFGASL